MDSHYTTRAAKTATSPTTLLTASDDPAPGDSGDEVPLGEGELLDAPGFDPGVETSPPLGPPEGTTEPVALVAAAANLKVSNAL